MPNATIGGGEDSKVFQKPEREYKYTCSKCRYRHNMECRLNPPTSILDDMGPIEFSPRERRVSSKWPIVEDNDWCYQFKSKF